MTTPTQISFHHNKIVKIASGSSHCIAIAMGLSSDPVEFTPVPFVTSEDQLGASLVPHRGQKDGPEGSAHHALSRRPLLTKIVLSQMNRFKIQAALGHILTALQITYARDAIVSSLGGVVVDAMATEQVNQMDIQNSVGPSLHPSPEHRCVGDLVSRVPGNGSGNEDEIIYYCIVCHDLGCVPHPLQVSDTPICQTIEISP